MATIPSLPSLRLKKREDRRLRAGHPWVFSNEVDTAITPLTGFEAGQAIRIEDAGGHTIGTGYVNPHALICARLISRDKNSFLDQSLLTHRLKIALSLRERLYDAPYYRLAFSDSDRLPGLVVDRYGGIVVAQITTAGMERLKNEIVAALTKVLAPQTILLRNDSSSREFEGLERYVETAYGEIVEPLILDEHGTRFEYSPTMGQKTGWFYDQRPNRKRMLAYIRGNRVLDAFSYLGAWGLQAACNGADSVLCVESSKKAVEGIRRNAELNRIGNNVATLHEDAFDALRDLRAARERFDVVVLDPPAFIKRKKDIKEGTLAYQRLNQLAMQVLTKDGILISCSCSYHLHRDALQNILLKTSRHLDRFLEIIEHGHQGPDHPVHPAIPETAYLKAIFTRVLPN